MAILSTAKIVGMLASAKKTGRQVMNAAGEWVAEVVEDFMSGFAGYGWKIWEYVKGKWMLEIDSIRVREQFIVFEMLVSKMRAIIGSLGISQACGKIATVTLSEDGTEYLITLEDETMSFVAHDFMRCQTYTGTKQTFYHVEISSVVDDVVHVPVSEFDKDAEGIVINPPEVGNDVVQFGNSVNKNRQSAIYIHADESGQPAIDIMFDIDSKDWTGKVKTRLGGDIPGGDGARGFYCENGMIKGTDTSGHTVYCIHPDGSAEFGDGSAKFNADKSGSLAGGAISWAWDASKNQFITSFKNVVIKWEDLDDEVKENLKGEKGDKGDKGDTGERGGDGTNGADGQDAVMFAIEFCMNGIQFQNIPCDIHSNPIGGNTLTAKLYRISGNTKEEYSEDNWIVTYLKNGSEVISWNVPEVPTASVDISLDRSFEYDSVLVNVYKVIPTNVLVTSGSISKVMSNVPDWLVGWDTNKVQIGSEYMISPKLFTGKNTGTAEEPILTGIVQGDKCITIDGVERSGIFALADNEIIFALDAKDGSGSLAKGTTYWDKFGQTYRKTREIIVWRRLSEEINAIIDKIENPEDYPDEYDLNLEYGTYLQTVGVDIYVNLPDPAECPGLIIDVYDMPRTRVLLNWAKFRCKISPILKANAAGVYEPVVVNDPGRMEFGSSVIRSEMYNDVYRWIADSDFVVVTV